MIHSEQRALHAADEAPGQQVADSQFAVEPLGHAFMLRKPLSKATAKKCVECGLSIFEHACAEVAQQDLRKVLEAISDSQPNQILPGLWVGSYKSVLWAVGNAGSGGNAECRGRFDWYVVNAAGMRLHAFLPATRPAFDRLREAQRILDLDWQDADDFDFSIAELVSALKWINQRLVGDTDASSESHAQISTQTRVLVNCAQGISRSGTVAVAYVMAAKGLSVDEGLRFVQACRASIQPNAGFIAKLRQHEAEIQCALV